MILALLSGCSESALKPEEALWGVWAYAGGENGSLEYASDLSFKEDGSLTLLDRPQFQAAYVVIAPGRIKLTVGGSSEVLNYSLEEDTLTLYVGEGHNTYTRAPETQLFARGEPMEQPPVVEPTNPLPVSTPTQKNLVEELVEQIFGDEKVITPDNVSKVVELTHLSKESVSEIIFSPDGALLAVGTNIGVYFHDVESLEELSFIETPSLVFSVAFSPDGRNLASGESDGTIHIWDVESGRLLRTLEGHTNGVNGLAFSPDGRSLASGGNDRGVRLWDVGSGFLLRMLDEHNRWVSSVVFSPAGRTLASGGEDGAVRLWDIESGMLLRRLEGHIHWVSKLVFSMDGGTLASGGEDGAVRVWDTKSGTLLGTLEGHTSWVLSIAFSLNGRMLASGGADGTVCLWDAGNGALLRTLEWHTDRVSSVAFSPDGRILASGSGDGTVRLWGIP